MDYRRIPLGTIDETSDSRDYTLETIMGVIPDDKYPKEVKRSVEWPIRNQGYTSQCHAYSVVKVLEIQHYFETGERIEFDPEFFYDQRAIKTINGMMPMFDNALARQVGMIPKEVYVTPDGKKAKWDKLSDELKAQMKKLAAEFRSVSTLKLSAEELPAYLHNWHAGTISIDVYDSFYRTGKDGIIPENTGTKLGGHSMVVDSIEMIGDVLHASGDNSYGEGWGDKGRFHIRLDHPAIKSFYGFVDANAQTMKVTLTIGSKTMQTSKGDIELPIDPRLIKDKPEDKNAHTMVPFRAITEIFDKACKYIPGKNGKPAKVEITMPQRVKDLLVI